MIPPTGRQIKAARALLDWSQRDLARKARVGLSTVRRMEGEAGQLREARLDTLMQVVQTLERGGVEFIDDVEGPGVRLRRRGR